ncbi:MAG: ThiF family adenylyltransferase [Planctomycetes bacterium]|nr:ThiF family adenylyltransferase [Planctomycetota bacterium]
MLFEPLGEQGQRRLGESRVTLIGCGALGSVLADTLVRAGVGFLRIVDRDFLELNNLQRQVLFDEQDVADQLPKAEAARRKLNKINSEVTVEGLIDDANNANIEALIQGADLILDGTDNFETRYLINEVSAKHKIPWIYGACVAATGLTMAIVPGQTPCLKCLFEQAPPPEMSPTCDTVGVLGPLVGIVAGLQAAEALKILSGNLDAVTRKLTSIDIWTGRIMQMNVNSAVEDCACCKRGVYEYLDGDVGQQAAVLCGRDAVQINQVRRGKLDLAALAEKLADVADEPAKVNDFLLQVRLGGCEITVFPNGRAIVKGTKDIGRARSLYAKYIGD